jgi:hypothetical protein
MWLTRTKFGIQEESVNGNGSQTMSRSSDSSSTLGVEANTNSHLRLAQHLQERAPSRYTYLHLAVLAWLLAAWVERGGAESVQERESAIRISKVELPRISVNLKQIGLNRAHQE